MRLLKIIRQKLFSFFIFVISYFYHLCIIETYMGTHF